MREVFLSHASRDHAKARRLRAVLTAHDVPVWFSPHHIKGAQQRMRTTAPHLEKDAEQAIPQETAEVTRYAMEGGRTHMFRVKNPHERTTAEASSHAHRS